MPLLKGAIFTHLTYDLYGSLVTGYPLLSSIVSPIRQFLGLTKTKISNRNSIIVAGKNIETHYRNCRLPLSIVYKI